MFLAVLLDRPALALRNVALAALLILIVFPESLFDVELPDVVRGGGGARRGLRGPRAPARESPARRMAVGAGCSSCSSAASCCRRWSPASPWRRSPPTTSTRASSSRCSPTSSPFRSATCWSCRRRWRRWSPMPFGLECWPLQVMGWGIDAMMWCALARGGAAGRRGCHSRHADGWRSCSMLAGGLWLMLWRTRWRLLGLAPIAAGLGAGAVAPAARHSDRQRRGAVAVRGRGRAAVGARRAAAAMFELERWLEHDGDARRRRGGRAGGHGRSSCDGDRLQRPR